MMTKLEAILNSLNIVSRGEQRGGGGVIWEKNFNGLFHVSEHLGHKAIKKKVGKKWKLFGRGVPPRLVKDQTISVFSREGFPKTSYKFVRCH